MLGNKRTSSFEGLFIYKLHGRFVVLDTTKGIRVTTAEDQSKAERLWAEYIGMGRSIEGSCRYTDEDKAIVKRNVTLRY
jgi:hypothetical protein